MLEVLSSIWVYLGLGIFLVALGFAIILSDWRRFLQHPILRRGKILPAMVASYFLVLASLTISTISRGHLSLAGGLIAIGMLQIFILLYKYRSYRQSNSLSPQNPREENPRRG